MDWFGPSIGFLLILPSYSHIRHEHPSSGGVSNGVRTYCITGCDEKCSLEGGFGFGAAGDWWRTPYAMAVIQVSYRGLTADCPDLLGQWPCLEIERGW